MKRIYDYARTNTLTQLEERAESWLVRIQKKDAFFTITIPVKIQELFWELTVKNEKVFEDWTDYYDGEPNELEKQKEEDCIKLMDSISKAESLRVETEGGFLKKKKLMIFRDEIWKDLTEEIWGEGAADQLPARRHLESE